MATFGTFANRLPDPAFNVAPDGSTTNAGAGDFGPGFASVKFTSEQPVSMTRTNSGRVITRAIVGHHWKIEISYHPMTCLLYTSPSTRYVSTTRMPTSA